MNIAKGSIRDRVTSVVTSAAQNRSGVAGVSAPSGSIHPSWLLHYTCMKLLSLERA